MKTILVINKSFYLVIISCLFLSSNLYAFQSTLKETDSGNFVVELERQVYVDQDGKYSFRFTINSPSQDDDMLHIYTIEEMKKGVNFLRETISKSKFPNYNYKSIVISDFKMYDPNKQLVESLPIIHVVYNPLVIEHRTYNSAPIAKSDYQETTENIKAIIHPLLNDYDHDKDKLSITNLSKPASGSVSMDGDELIYTPNSGFVGEDEFTYQAFDGESYSPPSEISVKVYKEKNRVYKNIEPEVYGRPETVAVVGEKYLFVPKFDDYNSDVLTTKATGLPNWLKWDSIGRMLRGKPTAADIGTHGPITITVSDAEFSTSMKPFSIKVKAK